HMDYPQRRLAGWILAAFAITFQVLVNIPVGGGYLRLGASDLLLPVFAGVVAWHAARHPAQVPRWIVPGLWFWLAALTAWLTVALVIGHGRIGAWQEWALVNKFAGWFVLVAYLVVGGWVAQFAGRPDEDRFVRWLAVLAAGLSLVSLARYLVMQAVNPELYPRLEGIAGNPNSFGCLLAVAWVVLVAVQSDRQVMSVRHFHWTIVSLNIGLLYAGSRSSWLGLVLGLAVLQAFHCIPWRPLLRASAVSAVLCALIAQVPPFIHATIPPEDAPNLSEPYFLRPSMVDDTGVSHRVRLMREALALWQENPVAGVGLGTFYWADRQAHGGTGAVIHNTALWLLTETGLVGVALFGGFFLAGTLRLWRRLRLEPDPLGVGILATLAIFLGASVGMEAMYQRHLWFLAGYALALRPPLRQAPV
ncbi:MAG: O-antigen ligase family protein, partial [Pseudomonadota bacterium]